MRGSVLDFRIDGIHGPVGRRVCRELIAASPIVVGSLSAFGRK
jgi:hypothetical protein